MADSFRHIDYRLRPAKIIERRMMAEAFQELRSFGPLKRYRYVGLGSVYFSDFALFHATCNFEDMVSIEDTEDLTKQNRFLFNAPLGLIQMEFGHTNTVLPKLVWDTRTVAWLDYDGALVDSVIRDVSFLATNLISGGLLAVSLNASLRDEENGEKKGLQLLTERLKGIQALPDWVIQQGSIGTNVGKVYRDILSQCLTLSLNARNAGLPKAQKLSSEQIFYFSYKDNAPMLTLGWVIFSDADREKFDACRFQDLGFTRTSEEAFNIVCPHITNAEVRAINRCHSRPGGQAVADLPIPPTEVTKFENLRRYWPLITMPELT